MSEELLWRVTVAGGKTSDPLDESTVRRLIEEGEVRPSSMVFDESANSWVPIKMVPRLWEMFPEQEAPEEPAVEEPKAHAQVQPAAASQQQEETEPASGAGGLAVASLAFGAASFLPFLRSFAWILGIIAAVSAIIRAVGDRYARAGMAVASLGLVLSLAGGALFVVVAALRYMGYAPSSNQADCLMQLRALSRAMGLYADDNNGLFPVRKSVGRAATAPDSFALLLDGDYLDQAEALYCPQCREISDDGKISGRTYAYVAGLGSQSPSFLPVAMDDLWAEGAFKVYAFDAHGVGGCNVLFVDGSAEWVPSSGAADACGDMRELRKAVNQAYDYGGAILWGHAAPGELDR